MEADWEIEIGGDAPVIEAHWFGFVDLRIEPSRANELPETRQLPGLADALAHLNATTSSVWTCKTDVFVPDQIDSDELDSEREEATHAIACYVDLLPRSKQQWVLPAQAEADCKLICAKLRSSRLSRCRADLVIRRAVIASDSHGLGVTAYLTACGATQDDAKLRLAECLAMFAGIVLSQDARIR
jgi:hypothetical protein